MQPQIRTVVVEDDGLFRDLLRTSLAQVRGIQVVGQYADGESALDGAVALDPQAAILDIELGPGINGIHLGRLLRRRLPRVGILLLSHHTDPAFLTAVPEDERAGWSYLVKSSVGNLATLCQAIEASVAGRSVTDPVLTPHGCAAGPLSALTPRQREILALIAQGCSNPAIALTLNIASKTVENQNNVIYQKLGLDPRDLSLQTRVRAALIYARAIRTG